MVTTTSASSAATMIQPASASPTPSLPSSPSLVPAEGNTGVRRISDNRRSNKPIMEKRRRARINNCLNELKTLILDAMKKDPARHSKLEKADILEMTVKHLQNLQRQQAVMSATTDSASLNKFRAGFSECASEVGRFPGLDPIVRRKLLQHLATCLSQGSKIHESPQVQVHILPNQKPLEPTGPHGNGIILSNSNGTSLQLVPTRLPNGDIALVLPTSLQAPTLPSPVPTLIPIMPERTGSAASGTSGYSNYSPSHSPEPADSVYSQPLSLVVRKMEPMDEDKPWRPW
ncbi:unnamed protein product [Phyllotreta striolata]|uniref:Hairy n=1 Tax=Phyllotreta striolata TaxID=444603 RepID=A0A9N9XQK0_PHYSR|nr:unnamed protein product [Phyllotreta striolata]